MRSLKNLSAAALAITFALGKPGDAEPLSAAESKWLNGTQVSHLDPSEQRHAEILVRILGKWDDYHGEWTWLDSSRVRVYLRGAGSAYLATASKAEDGDLLSDPSTSALRGIAPADNYELGIWQLAEQCDERIALYRGGGSLGFPVYETERYRHVDQTDQPYTRADAPTVRSIGHAWNLSDGDRPIVSGIRVTTFDGDAQLVCVRFLFTQSICGDVEQTSFACATSPDGHEIAAVTTLPRLGEWYVRSEIINQAGFITAVSASYRRFKLLANGVVEVEPDINHSDIVVPMVVEEHVTE